MTVSVGLVGTGTVGGGCIDIFQKNKDSFAKHFGIDIELSRVCSHTPRVAKEHGLEDLFTPDYHDVINDPNIDIVVELIGGTDTAFDVITEALAAGKHVVTANKAVMASRGGEVLACAKANNREILFEGSVGGGIPIIGPMKHSLIANNIDSVVGIVNGTTNYMLTRMVENKLTYEDALKEAQDLGFAEADPTADVDGFDAAAKIAILASIAFNSRVTLDDVYTEGIRRITPEDLAAAHDMGYCVKLLAIAHRSEQGIDVRVHPTMLPLSHPLATVNDVFNAIYLVGDFVGETMFFGRGAGAGAAASAVMGDVLEIARHIQLGTGPIVGCTCTDEVPLVSMEELRSRYYIRFTVVDQPGVLATMAQVFANYGVSVHSVVQRGKGHSGAVNLAYVTHTAKEKDIRSILAGISALDGILLAEPSLIRVEGQS